MLEDRTRKVVKDRLGTKKSISRTDLYMYVVRQNISLTKVKSRCTPWAAINELITTKKDAEKWVEKEGDR